MTRVCGAGSALIRRLEYRISCYHVGAKNVGLRNDFRIATPKLAVAAKRAAIYRARHFSDHAPLAIEYDYNL